VLEDLKRLCMIPGVSGREHDVRAAVIDAVGNFGSYSVDALGNLIVFKKGRQSPKKKIMVAAHIDEVGLIVLYITDEGFLKFTTVGGIATGIMPGKRVLVGDGRVPGVIGIKPVHLTDKKEAAEVPAPDVLYIDIGVSSRAQAEKFVCVGDCAVFDSEPVEFGDGLFKARALDDRCGCAILLNIIRSEIEYDTYFVFTVQEEVGLRGASVAAYRIEPDYAIVVETTTAADIPGVDGEKRVCLLGGGAVVSFMDKTTMYDRKLYDAAFKLGEAKGIRMQTKTLVAGGNDAGSIHKSRGGVKTLTVSVPCRYLHSPACVISIADAQEVCGLVDALIGMMADDSAH